MSKKKCNCDDCPECAIQDINEISPELKEKLKNSRKMGGIGK